MCACISHRLLPTTVQSIVKVGGGENFKGKVEKEVSLHYSNVALVDPTDGKPCRIIYRYLEDGKKVRVSTRSKRIIPFPVREEDYFKEAQQGKNAEQKVVILWVSHAMVKRVWHGVQHC